MDLCEKTENVPGLLVSLLFICNLELFLMISSVAVARFTSFTLFCVVSSKENSLRYHIGFSM